MSMSIVDAANPAMSKTADQSEVRPWCVVNLVIFRRILAMRNTGALIFRRILARIGWCLAVCPL